RNLHHAFAYDPVHHADVLGEAPAAGLKTGSRAHFLIDRTLGENLLAAVIALTAGNMVEDHDAVAFGKALYALAPAYNLPRHLVTKDPWSRMRAGGNLLEIGSADAAGMHAHQQLSWTDIRNGHGFQANIVLAAVHCRLHGSCSNDRRGLGISFYGCM